MLRLVNEDFEPTPTPRPRPRPPQFSSSDMIIFGIAVGAVAAAIVWSVIG